MIALKWRFWWRYKRLKKKYRKLGEELSLTKIRHQAQVASLKQFYEKALATERFARQKRDDGWADAFLQLQKVLPVSYKTVGAADQVQLPPDIDDLPESELKYDLTEDQEDYVDEARNSFYEFGREAGRSESDILTLWKREGYKNAVEEAMNEVLGEY